MGLTPSPFWTMFKSAQSVERDIPNLTHKWWSPYVVQKIKITIIEDKYKNAHLCDLQAGRLGFIARSQMLNRRQWVIIIILYLIFTTITTPTIVLSPFPSSVVSTCSPPTSQISWIRLADYRILTNGLLTFTTDDRLPQNIKHSIIISLKSLAFHHLRDESKNLW